MSAFVLAEKDPAIILADALEAYRVQTGITLAPADPRRLFMQTFILREAQLRGLIDFSGKASWLRYVTSENIDGLAELWGLFRLVPAPSRCTLRFHFTSSSSWTVDDGTRATDGTNIWTVLLPTGNTGYSPSNYVDALAECTVSGGATNGVAIGQIATLVDAIANCSGVDNTTVTAGGRDIETTEAFRERLRSAPESRSTAGPRAAYRAYALEASASVADAAVFGPNDAGLMHGTPPTAGGVHVLIIEGERNAAGVLTSVVPEPSGSLLAQVETALSPDDIRPLGDLVEARAPIWSDFDISVDYYIDTVRVGEVDEINDAVEAAYQSYILWQTSKIGRDINPSELIARLMAAGARRVVVTLPVYTPLERDQCARLIYDDLDYLGTEED